MKQIDAKKIPKTDWDILCASFLAYMERKRKESQPVMANKNAAALQSVPQETR
ncbi:MAG: hypothetical protein IJH14_06645 [Solobacterium sp.]|nr:hypothetical protein [Solobacterium sp.]